MSRDSTSGTDEPVAPVGAVRALVSGGEPYTTNEVAMELDVSTRLAEQSLAQLEEEGVLASKTVSDGTETTAIWYRPIEVLDPEDEETVDEAVEETVAGMAVPGASEMMRDWRRDAVRATVEALREDGPMSAAEIREAVFGPHSAGFDDPQDWWAMLHPRLAQVPYVHPPDGDEGWTFDAA